MVVFCIIELVCNNEMGCTLTLQLHNTSLSRLNLTVLRPFVVEFRSNRRNSHRHSYDRALRCRNGLPLAACTA